MRLRVLVNEHALRTIYRERASLVALLENVHISVTVFVWWCGTQTHYTSDVSLAEPCHEMCPHGRKARLALAAVVVGQLLIGVALDVQQLPVAQLAPQLRREAHQPLLRKIFEKPLDQEALKGIFDDQLA